MTTEAQMREQFEAALEQAYWDWKDGPNPHDLSERDRFKQQVRALCLQSATEQMKPLVEALRESQDILSRAKALYDISSCGNSGWNEALCERITLNGQALATIEQDKTGRPNSDHSGMSGGSQRIAGESPAPVAIEQGGK